MWQNVSEQNRNPAIIQICACKRKSELCIFLAHLVEGQRSSRPYLSCLWELFHFHSSALTWFVQMLWCFFMTVTSADHAVTPELKLVGCCLWLTDKMKPINFTYLHYLPGKGGVSAAGPGWAAALSGKVFCGFLCSCLSWCHTQAIQRWKASKHQERQIRIQAERDEEKMREMEAKSQAHQHRWGRSGMKYTEGEAEQVMPLVNQSNAV